MAPPVETPERTLQLEPEGGMTSSGRLHLVRHAETLFNVNQQLQGWCDSPLTERGEHQIVALGEWMQDVPLTGAFMSDLTRTRTTAAAALIGHPGIEPVPLPELREWHFGGWEGQPNQDLWTPVFASLGGDYTDRAASWPAMTELGFDGILDTIARLDPVGRAETGIQVRKRVAAGLAIVLDAVWNDGEVLTVTHGSVMNSILRHLAPDYRLQPGFPNCGIITIEWCDGQMMVKDLDASCSFPASEYPEQ